MNRDQIIETLALNNEKTYNLLKSVEECTEFSENIIKFLTKDSTHKPSGYDIMCEFFDMVFRAEIAVMSLHSYISEEESKKAVLHMEEKYKKIETLIKNKQKIGHV